MKNLMKYIISTIIFFAIFTISQWLFVKTIAWDITIISTVVYAIVNTAFNMLTDKMAE